MEEQTADQLHRDRNQQRQSEGFSESEEKSRKQGRCDHHGDGNNACHQKCRIDRMPFVHTENIGQQQTHAHRKKGESAKTDNRILRFKYDHGSTDAQHKVQDNYSDLRQSKNLNRKKPGHNGIDQDSPQKNQSDRQVICILCQLNPVKTLQSGKFILLCFHNLIPLCKLNQNCFSAALSLFWSRSSRRGKYLSNLPALKLYTSHQALSHGQFQFSTQS